MILFLSLLQLHDAIKTDYEWRMGYGDRRNKVVRLKSQIPQELLQRKFKDCFKNY